MAQFRPSGTERYFHHDGSGGGGAGGNGASEQISIRIPPHKAAKIRRRQDKALRRASLPCIVVGIFLGFLVTIFAFQYISNSSGIHGRFDQSPEDIELKNDVHDDFRPRFNRSTQINRELRFGRGSVAGGRDSRYWDRDDRRRDDEYDEDGLELPGNEGDNVTEEKEERKLESRSSRKFDVGQGVGGLYNEAGRNELQKFEEKYKESLKNSDQTSESGEVSSTDEYDDGIDIEDVLDELENGDENQQTHNDNLRLSGSQKQVKSTEENSHSEALKKGTSIVSLGSNYNAKSGHGHPGIADGLLGKPSDSVKKNSLKKKSPKRRRISGSHCEMKLLNSSQLLEPLENKKFSRFSLQYTETEERPVGLQNWEPRFAGHQTLHEREESFYARDQKINCGFVKGPKDMPSTGFDLAEDDVKFMSSCHVAVSSCIFGNSDNLRIPYTKTITRSSRKNVCFVMFVDETTLQTLSSEGHKPDPTGLIGLWKIVVVKNLPYNDMRRVGKIPKFLAHRLFPSARYSIWLDSKLRLQSDPLLILEYFLWRKGHEYAISNHYDRHCVWEEVMQNKKLNKFNHTIIDEQFAFYQADGLKRFDPTDPNKLLPSYVPEGSFILRAHTPMSNLFSCLWFNEVDRFTPRDQLSFAYTYLKLRRMNPGKPFHLHMFKDCERRTIAKLFHHRGEDKRTIPGQAIM